MLLSNFSLHAHCSPWGAAGTYGGHLELSAFAHLTRRNVKVIQPGLVYVIEWAAGGDVGASTHSNASTDDDSSLDERERRQQRRDQKRADRRQVDDMDDDSDNDDPVDPSSGAVYVAYVLWYQNYNCA